MDGEVLCNGCGKRFRREDVASPDDDPRCTACCIAKAAIPITGAWRVDFFYSKKAAQVFADKHATRNTPITKTGMGWRLYWLPPNSRYS